ncbi:hypothetical protein HA075_20470 [bacterium BFN5]|nr:hypothetical protein HA075_20470 [bacterium BFN5]
MAKEKVYKFWNGKNIDGDSAVGNKHLIEEGIRSNTTEMKYEVGVDTISADDLQKGVQYE